MRRSGLIVWLLAVGVMACGQSDDDVTADPATACANETLSGLLPITVPTVETDRVYLWKTAVEEPSDSETTKYWIGIELQATGSVMTPEERAKRTMTVRDRCDGEPIATGSAGTKRSITSKLGAPVLVFVTGCKADCKLSLTLGID